MREHKPFIWTLLGGVLAAYGVVAALQPILMVEGGVSIHRAAEKVCPRKPIYSRSHLMGLERC
jgi:hypothetical protein